MKILRKIYLKIDDYFNFSSTCKVKMSIHLLFNSAMIKKFLNYPSKCGSYDQVIREGQCLLGPLAMTCYILREVG